LAALALVLLAAALYVSPLCAFFAAQDSYFGQRAALSRIEAANRALRREVANMHSAAYLVRAARKEFQLVPSGLQPFVVKGLPPGAPSPAPTATPDSVPPRPSLVARLSDLWHTMLE
jgi:cell division protein FtsB